MRRPGLLIRARIRRRPDDDVIIIVVIAIIIRIPIPAGSVIGGRVVASAAAGAFAPGEDSQSQQEQRGRCEDVDDSFHDQ